MPALLERLNDELAAVVGTVRDSLVQVRSGRHGGGAGTIWHPDGLILTNAHVIGRGQIRVTFSDGRTLPAQVLARDTDLDVAAVAVDATGLPTIPLGESRRLRPGELVLALGHPWGVVGAVAAGVVIGAGPRWPRTSPPKPEWIVVGLNLRPGNSGGPLTDVHGRLVGINTIMTGPEVGMAVPVHVVKGFLRKAVDSRAATAQRFAGSEIAKSADPLAGEAGRL